MNNYNYRKITKKKVAWGKLLKELLEVVAIVAILVFTISYSLLQDRVSELELKTGNMLENYLTIQEYETLENGGN